MCESGVYVEVMFCRIVAHAQSYMVCIQMKEVLHFVIVPDSQLYLSLNMLLSVDLSVCVVWRAIRTDSIHASVLFMISPDTVYSSFR